MGAKELYWSQISNRKFENSNREEDSLVSSIFETTTKTSADIFFLSNEKNSK